MYSFDALSLCQEEHRPESASGGMEVWYAVDPATLYPDAVAEIRKALELPMGDIPEGYRQILIRARKLPAAAWDLALMRRDDVSDPVAVQHRAEALECARLWFTRALKIQAGRPLGLHITMDPDFRL